MENVWEKKRKSDSDRWYPLQIYIAVDENSIHKHGIGIQYYNLSLDFCINVFLSVIPLNIHCISKNIQNILMFYQTHKNNPTLKSFYKHGNKHFDFLFLILHWLTDYHLNLSKSFVAATNIRERERDI